MGIEFCVGSYFLSFSFHGLLLFIISVDKSVPLKVCIYFLNALKMPLFVFLQFHHDGPGMGLLFGLFLTCTS